MDNNIDTGKLEDSELKKTYGLEFLTTMGETNGKERKIGFAKGKLVIMNVEGNRCEHIETPIGESLYNLFRDQALRGEYRSAREFLQALERKTHPISY